MSSICKSEREEDMYLQKFKFAIENCDNKWVKLDMENWSDDMLFLFLRSRNYDVQSALERIQKMISAMRSTHSQIFQDMYPSKQKFNLENGTMKVLKNRDSKGCTIFLHQQNSWTPNETNPDDAMKAIILFVIEVLHNKQVQEKGCVIIWDMAGLTLAQAATITPGLITKYATLINNANPLKVKGIHILNAPRMFNMLLTFIKLVLSKKINKRINTHGSSLESFHKHVSPDILPKQYGGKLDDSDAYDKQIVPNLLTHERNEYYKRFLGGPNTA